MRAPLITLACHWCHGKEQGMPALASYRYCHWHHGGYHCSRRGVIESIEVLWRHRASLKSRGAAEGLLTCSEWQWKRLKLPQGLGIMRLALRNNNRALFSVFPTCKASMSISSGMAWIRSSKGVCYWFYEKAHRYTKLYVLHINAWWVN